MLVFLVRHAQSIRRGDWQSADLDRPLNGRGNRQAPVIASSIKVRLDGAPVHIVSSPALRCVQTIGPLADTLGIDVQTDDRLVEAGHVPPAERPPKAAIAGWLGVRSVDVLSEHVSMLGEGGAIVLCTHGELIPPTLERLCPDGTVEVSAIQNQKGGFWQLRLKGGRCVRTEYVPAPET